MTEGVLFTIDAQQARPFVHGNNFRSFVKELEKEGLKVLSEKRGIDCVPFTFMVISDVLDSIKIERKVIVTYRKYDLPNLDVSKDVGYSKDIL